MGEVCIFAKSMFSSISWGTVKWVYLKKQCRKFARKKSAEIVIKANKQCTWVIITRTGAWKMSGRGGRGCSPLHYFFVTPFSIMIVLLLFTNQYLPQEKESNGTQSTKIFSRYRKKLDCIAQQRVGNLQSTVQNVN